MKKLIYSLMVAGALFSGFVALHSCSEDKEDGPRNDASQTFADEYFGVENATYNPGTIPSDADGTPISGMTINSQALTGGMNFVTIHSETEYAAFMVGVQGVDGYWELPATEATQAADRSRAGYFTYIIPLNFGVNYNESIVLIIVAIDTEGHFTAPSENTIDHVESKWGDLNINLTFSNAKDVDLHLFTPSGVEIYYGNRGGYYFDEERDEDVYYGLDHDSNAACAIDNLNNENIVIPAALIEPGIYTVRVNMWSNCDRTIPTNWAIAARFMDRLISPIEGQNPASGVYPVGCGSDDHTFVMSFSILDAPANAAARSALRITPAELTESAQLKLECKGNY